MPWKECNRMDERLRFVARLLDGEKMAVACREFGISRKTGYKIFNRYKEFGVRGLEDRSKSAYRHPNKLPFQIEKAILRIKTMKGRHPATCPGNFADMFGQKIFYVDTFTDHMGYGMPPMVWPDDIVFSQKCASSNSRCLAAQ